MNGKKSNNHHYQNSFYANLLREAQEATLGNMSNYASDPNSSTLFLALNVEERKAVEKIRFQSKRKESIQYRLYEHFPTWYVTIHTLTIFLIALFVCLQQYAMLNTKTDAETIHLGLILSGDIILIIYGIICACLLFTRGYFMCRITVCFSLFTMLAITWIFCGLSVYSLLTSPGCQYSDYTCYIVIPSYTVKFTLFVMGLVINLICIGFLLVIRKLKTLSVLEMNSSTTGLDSTANNKTMISHDV